jgi:ubiquinone/menaquinone biosynthesis C-methylase UbiE
MTTMRESWDDGERAERFARESKILARMTYAPFARNVVRTLGTLAERATIVDLGTGPGLLAVEIHRLCPQASIIGIDPSNAMLQIARKNAARAGMSVFQAKLGSAEDMLLTDASVDAVVSQSSFHEWEAPHLGLAEAFRVLKPGGRLILRDYNAAWLTPWKRKVLGSFHHLDMFKFTFEQAAGLLREAGFVEASGKGSGLQWFITAEKPA